MPVAAGRSWLRPLWAGLLSLVLPGLGQVYARCWRLGVVLFGCVSAFEILAAAFTQMVPPEPNTVAAFFVVVGLFAILRLAIAVDAARRVRRGATLGRVPWYRSTWFTAIVALGIAIALPSFGWSTYSIPSSSNMPTLLIGDHLVADTSRPGALPSYGDVVVFRHTRDPKTSLIKRVVGLPGDRVQMQQGILYLNGNAVPRTSAGRFTEANGRRDAAIYRETLPNGRGYSIIKMSNAAIGDKTQEYLVPPGHFFTLGDNRDDSLDSRMLDGLGYVPAANVIGTARTIYWAREMKRLLTRIE